jgi:N utilization substance protein A
MNSSALVLDSAKSVLNLNKEELVRRTDLEEETIEGVLGVLKKEFEQGLKIKVK